MLTFPVCHFSGVLDAPVLARSASDVTNDGFDAVLTLDPAPADGVLLVASAIGAGETFTPPAGWTSTVANTFFWKVASGEGTTFTFALTGSKGDAGGPVVMAEITGVGGTPIEDTDTTTGTATTPAGTSLGPNRIAIAMATDSAALTSLTNGWTVEIEATGDSRWAAIGYKEIPDTGSTGTSDWAGAAINLVTFTVKP